MFFLANASIVTNFFRSLMTDISGFIYRLLIFFFEMFETLGSAELIKSDYVQELFQKFSLLIGLFMVFRLSFAFIQYIINPDEMTDKAKGVGNIIKRVVVSVILLVTTPMLFRMAFRVQKIIIDEQILSKIILGNTSESSEDSSNGTRIAGELFFAFFRPIDGVTDTDRISRYNRIKRCYINGGCNWAYIDEYSKGNGIGPGSSDDEIYDAIKTFCLTSHKLDSKEECLKAFHSGKLSFFGSGNIDTLHFLPAGDFEAISYYINAPNRDKKLWESFEDYQFAYDAVGLAALLVGILACYIIITYTIQVGIRAVQLGYLQIIAPIPILMYMTPKGDETLKKWFKQCTTTFLDFFIRSAILFFAVHVIRLLAESFSTLDSSIPWTHNVIKDAYLLVILIIAVLLFAKKAPKLLQEIFPSAGGASGFDFGLNNSYLKGAATLAGGMTAGAVGGIITGVKHGEGTRFGRVGGAVTGMFRGAAGGAKTKGNIFKNAQTGMANQRAAMQRAYERNQDESTFLGRTLFSTSESRKKDNFEKELQAYSNYEAVVKSLDTELEKDANVQVAMNRKQALMDRQKNGGPAATAAEIKAADDLIKKAKKSVLQQEIGRGTNAKIMQLVGEADAIRASGVDKGYVGFGTTSMTDTSIDARTRVNAFYNNRDDARTETYNIKSPGGARNAEYETAKDNAKYNKSK